MGKDGFMTPKAIANRIKAKGLQKLRWYCQLCEKQCRDENGFKCHQTSEGHLRKMQQFGSDADGVVDKYSQEFEQAFLDHLKRAHPFSRVLAKNVYNEFISDRHHVHMNSTKWLTLTDFVKYLGKEGKCKVDQTEKGWWITLVMKDPMQEIEEERRLKRTVAEKEEEERHMAEINAQIERARKAARLDDPSNDDTHAAGPSGGDVLVKTDDAPIVLSLTAGGGGGAGEAGEAGRPGPSGLPPRAPGRQPLAARPKAAFGDDEDDDTGAGPSTSGRVPGKGSSKLDELMKKELEAKAKHQADLAQQAAASAAPAPTKRGPWLSVGLVVKVMSKQLEPHGYYKKKGVIDRVLDKGYVGEVAMIDSGDVVRVDQAQLETVIPQRDGQVLVVAGRHKGCKAVLREIDTDKYKARVRLSDGPDKGSDYWADYEDICKVSSSA